MPGQISQTSFSTRAFMIRYQEEEVELNDIAHFKLELEPFAETDTYLEVDLMFSDLVALGGPDKF